jgi:hypothetical protein
MENHAASQSDRDFRAAFESCAVAPARFNHEAHLRLAYVYLVEGDLASAHEKMRGALLAFLNAYNIPPEKFHETLTQAWVLAVWHFMSRSPSHSFAEFADKSQPLLDSRVMFTHYSETALFSPSARAAYVAPDLEAIPLPGVRS